MVGGGTVITPLQEDEVAASILRLRAAGIDERTGERFLCMDATSSG